MGVFLVAAGPWVPALRTPRGAAAMRRAHVEMAAGEASPRFGLTEAGSPTSVAFVTGPPPAAHGGSGWAALPEAPATWVFPGGAGQLSDHRAALLAAGVDPATPAAIVEPGSGSSGTTPVGTAATLASVPGGADGAAAGVGVVGEVLSAPDALAWLSGRPLLGRTVVVTRPAGQGADALVDHLTERGASVLRAPGLALRAPSEPAPWMAALACLGDYDWLVLTSRSAVEHTAAALAVADVDRGALASVRVACVGPATAKRAWDLLGVRAALTPQGKYRAAALGEALVARGVRGQRVLHPRASAASGELALALRSAGATVDDPVAYETCLGPGDGAELRRALTAGAVDALTFASGSAVEGVVAMIGPQALLGVTLAAIGPVTAEAARRHGLDVDVVPGRSTAIDLVDALVAHLR